MLTKIWTKRPYAHSITRYSLFGLQLYTIEVGYTGRERWGQGYESAVKSRRCGVGGEIW